MSRRSKRDTRASIFSFIKTERHRGRRTIVIQGQGRGSAELLKGRDQRRRTKSWRIAGIPAIIRRVAGTLDDTGKVPV